MSDPEIFVKCSCYGEGVFLSHDAEDNLFYLSLWSFYVNHAAITPWSARLRHIWQILRTGTPFRDNVILSHDEANKIADFLRRYSGNAVVDVRV